MSDNSMKNNKERRRSSMLMVQRSEKPFAYAKFIASNPCLSIIVTLSIVIILSVISIHNQVRSGRDLINTPRSDADIAHPSARDSHALEVTRDLIGASLDEDKLDEVTEQQTETGAILFLTLEAPGSNLLTATNLKKAKEIQDILINDENYPTYCKRIESQDLPCNQTFTEREMCAPIASPLMFYFSSIDITIVNTFIDTLKNTEDYSNKQNLVAQCISRLPGELFSLSTNQTKIYELFGYVNTIDSTKVSQLSTDLASLTNLVSLLQPSESSADNSCKSPGVNPQQYALMQFMTLSTSTLLFDFLCPAVRSISWVDKMNILNLLTQLQSEILNKADGKSETLIEDHEKLTELIFLLYQNIPQLEQGLNFYFTKSFGNTSESKFSRILVEYGLPLKGYKNSNDEKDKQMGNFTQYFKKNIQPEIKEFSLYEPGNFKAYYVSTSLISSEVTNILITDSIKALASLAFVFGYLCTQTGSFFLGSVGMMEIILSLPLAFSLYSFLGFSFLSIFCPMCVYIIAAIGADDIFIFMDAYRASAFEGKSVLKSFEHRLSWVYRRAAGAMFITSLTTMAAFLATAFTELATVKSFGIFAALVILSDYILVITFFPSCLAFYHNRMEGAPGRFSCCNSSHQTPTENLYQDNEIAKPRKIQLLLEQKFAPLILSGKYVFIGIFVIFAVINAIFASKVKATTAEDQILPKEHPFQKTIDISNEFFFSSSTDSNSKITYYWGLDGINRDGVNLLIDPTYLGAPQFSPSFKLDEEAQIFLLNFCYNLSNDIELVARESGTFNPQATGSRACFIEDLKRYVEGNGETFPIPESVVFSTMQKFLTEFGEYKNLIGILENKIVFVALQFETTVDKYKRYDNAQLQEFYSSYENYLSKEMRNAPTSLPRGAQTMERNLWIRMRSQEIYVQSAINGSIIGACLAFIVILLATLSLRIALFAAITIGGVLVSVLGFMNIVGWELGTIEAINITILAGFSVDYVVHLAHAFNVSESTSRCERVKDAIKEIGISVFSGMITSIGASVILFFCQLQFFAKFGAFLCVTIGYSYLWANFFFLSLLAIAGPHNNFVSKNNRFPISL